MNTQLAAWNHFLAMTERFESGRTVGLRGEDFTIDGELKGISSIGYTQPADDEPWVGYQDIGFFEADKAGAGIEDFALLDDFGGTPTRWEHERDAFLEQQAEWRRTYLSCMRGSNPRATYLWRKSQERKQRVAKLIRWIETAPLNRVLAARQVFNDRRKASIAQTLGFSQVPQGAWPGVEGNPNTGLVRRYREGDVEITRIPDWSGIYLTKAQMKLVQAALDRRCY